MKFSFLIFIFLLLIIPLGYAEPPFQQTISKTGFVVITPSEEYIQFNSTYKVHAHVINATNGVEIIPTSPASCTIHIYNKSGGHTVNQSMTADSNTREWNYNWIPAQIGQHEFYIYCNNSAEGGATKYSTYVTYTGYTRESGESTKIALYVMFILAFFAFMGFVSFQEPKVLKWGFFFIGFILISVGVGLVGISLRNEQGNSNIATFYDQFTGNMMMGVWIVGGLLFIIWAVTTIAMLWNRQQVEQARRVGAMIDYEHGSDWMPK